MQEELNLNFDIYIIFWISPIISGVMVKGQTARVWKWRDTICLKKMSATLVGWKRKFSNLTALKWPEMLFSCLCIHFIFTEKATSLQIKNLIEMIYGKSPTMVGRQRNFWNSKSLKWLQTLFSCILVYTPERW